MSASDQTLIEKICQRDAVAFETLFARYQEPVRQHIARIVRDENATEDLVQETFLRVWTRADQWAGRGEFKGWLYRIGTNVALNHLRTVRRHRQQPLEIHTDDADDEEQLSSEPHWMVDARSPGPGVVLEQAERRDLLWQLVDGLPKGKREVLYLVYRSGMDLREVAAEIGIPEGTVKSRLHYTLKRLAAEWKEIAAEWEEA